MMNQDFRAPQDVPGPDPARAPPNKAIAMAGSLVGGSRPGSPCQPRSATRSAAAPASGARLVHVWATRHRNRAVHNGPQRCVVRPGRRGDPTTQTTRVAQTTGRKRGEGGRPSGNSTSTSGTSPKARVAGGCGRPVG